MITLIEKAYGKIKLIFKIKKQQFKQNRRDFLDFYKLKDTIFIEKK